VKSREGKGKKEVEDKTIHPSVLKGKRCRKGGTRGSFRGARLLRKSKKKSSKTHKGKTCLRKKERKPYREFIQQGTKEYSSSNLRGVGSGREGGKGKKEKEKQLLRLPSKKKKNTNKKDRRYAQDGRINLIAGCNFRRQNTKKGN